MMLNRYARGVRTPPRLRGGMVVTAALVALFASHARAQHTVGVFQNEPDAQDGYTLLCPANSTESYLIDNNGYVVHSWPSAYEPGTSCYLLPDGNLIRGGEVSPPPTHFQAGNGKGGVVEEIDWDGNVVWSHEIATNSRLQHHDIVRLPNGNTVMMVWEHKTRSQAIAAGRDPDTIPDDSVWNDLLVEVDPAGNVVWEWSPWNHLVQDFDPTKDNFGVIADNPGKIDLNAVPIQDFIHMNGIAYDAVHDQIVVSVREYSEFWILDHGTTTAEAAGDTGGPYGKGGQLLYRWGNPQIYGRGTPADRRLEHQHDSHWIPTVDPEERRILLFNNGDTRGYSTADEIVLPIDADGVFAEIGSGAHGPAAADWSYVADPPESLFSPIISGADRLANGNTIITEGVTGRIVEVAPDDREVWEYVNPIGIGGVPLEQGESPMQTGIIFENALFKVRKYPADYPAFDGRDLAPQDLLESFTSPAPVSDGSGAAAPLRASRLTAAGDQIEVTWDSTSCGTSSDYNLIYGPLADVATYATTGGACGIGTSGVHTWTDVPADDLFFLLVGTDPTGVYESLWGADGAGDERNGAVASFQCGTTTKDVTATCP